MNVTKRLLFSALLAPLLGGAAVHAAEFEVMDRFSVDGYSVLRGSADIPGGSFAVGGSTFVVKDGKVGIGTASPGSLLSLYSAGVNPTLNITDASGAGTRGALLAGSWGGNGAYLDSLASAGWVYLGSSPGGGHAGQVVAYTAGLERMRVDSSGSVGIGTIAPGAGLHVISTDTMSAAFKVQTGSISGTEVVISTAGNIGIGTTNPTVKLDIIGTDAVRIPSGTTQQRPASAANGMMRLNTTTGKLEYYNNGGWNSVGGIAATGGTITDSNGYRTHTFTGSGTFNITGAGGSVEVEMLGGGGGGSTGNGQWAAGGGGAGYLKVNFTVTAGASYSVTLGTKGLGQTVCDNLNASGTAGGNSAFSTLSAYGGGRATQPTIAGIGGGFTTTGAAGIIATGNGTNGNASTGDSSGGGGNNGGGVTYGTGAAGVANGNPGNHASGNGNGGGGGHSCQGGHRGGGNGSDGIVIVRYPN